MWITVPWVAPRKVGLDIVQSRTPPTVSYTIVKACHRSSDSNSRNVRVDVGSFLCEISVLLLCRDGPLPGKDAGIDPEGFPVDPSLLVSTDVKGFQEFVPCPVSLPVPVSIVRGLPCAVSLWKIPPGCPGAQYPQDAVDHLPVIPPWPPAPLVSRKEWLDKFPLRVG